jgi:hypothetical protein
MMNQSQGYAPLEEFSILPILPPNDEALDFTSNVDILLAQDECNDIDESNSIEIIDDKEIAAHCIEILGDKAKVVFRLKHASILQYMSMHIKNTGTNYP